MSETVVTVTGLGKSYPLAENHPERGKRKRRLPLPRLIGSRHPDSDNIHWALKDVSFSVHRSERIGIVGRNGAGKSTLLKIMSRVTYPTVGEIRIKGTLTSLLEVGTGFNDNLSGRENVFLNASLYGLSRERTRERFDEIVEFSGVHRFIDTPLKHYSSGMRMRLAFSVAAHLDPDILLLDEVLAVGDMAFQRKCLERVDDLTSKGQTLFFVSHSMDSVMRYCDRCLWIENGRLRMDGDAESVCSAYVEDVLSGNSNYGSARSKAVGQQNSGSESATEAVINSSLAATSQKTDTDLTPATSNATSVISDEAPQAFLVSAAVTDSTGQEKIMHRVSDGVGIEIVYDVTSPGMYIPGVQLICPQGTLAFVSVPPARDPAEYHHAESGRYRASVWIEPHLLNIGTYSVTISLFSADENPFKRHFKKERLLTFQTIEPGSDELSARGCLPRPLPGAVRPKLAWRSAKVNGPALTP